MKKLGLVFGAVVFILSAGGQAATVTWDGSGDMNWDEPDATSWGTDTYNSGDDAQFTGTGTGTVTVAAGGVTPGSVTVSSGNYTFSGGAIGGTGVLTKSGSGTLTLNGTNTYSGGTTLTGGTLRVYTDSNLGASNTAITFDGSATIYNDQGGNTIIDLGARPITLNNSAIATFRMGRGDGFRTTGAVTGDGGVAMQIGGGNLQAVELLSASNTFTGPIEIQNGSDRPRLRMNSLADSVSPITLADSNGEFVWLSTAVGALTLNNRPIVAASNGGAINNQYSSPVTINSSITASATGSRRLGLYSGLGGTVNADINEGTATLGFQLSGAWDFTGNNTFSGLTTLNKNASLQLKGAQAMDGNASYQFYRGARLELLTDDSGTVSGASGIVLRRNDTSSGIMQNYTVYVDNNGGVTTGTTVAVGNVDYSVGDRRPPRQLNFEGGNGYSVQVGDVILDTEMISTVAGGNQRLRGNSAAVEITGTVKQVDGKTAATNTSNSDKFFLGGTSTGNEVSGVIADADDYTGGTNANAQPLNLHKGESGTWTLSGVNTYTGDTTIADGILEIGGSGQLGGGNYAGNITIGNGKTFKYNSSADQILGGTLGGSGGIVVKDGDGTLTLSGSNTYTGPTTVDGGTLLVNGSLDLLSPVTVNSGGTLGGTGTVGGSTTILAGGLLAPGASIGNLTFGSDLDISDALTGASASQVFELGASPLSDVVTLVDSSQLTIGTGLMEWDDFAFSGSPSVGTYTLFDTSAPIIGTLGTNLSGAISPVYNGQLSISDNDILLAVSFIPEPTSLLLVVLGMGGVALRRRR